MLNTTLTNKRRDVSDRANNFIDRTGRNVDQIHNSFLAILEPAEASEILDYQIKVGRSKINWVYYRNKYGKKIATFLSQKEIR